jgi:carboxyl-terminal processing protease
MSVFLHPLPFYWLINHKNAVLLNYDRLLKLVKMPRSNFIFGLLPAIAVAGAVLVSQPAPSPAALSNSPKSLVDEAWQIINHHYVDRTFNRNDWIKVRQSYLQRAYTSPDQAYEAIQEMLGKLDDPYTSLLTAEQIKSLVNDVSGDFVGIGLTVQLDLATREWIVVNPMQGSPANAAGILPKDVVVAINGTKTAEIDTNKAAKYLVGAVGSPVNLMVRRGTQNLQFKLVRDHIDLHPLSYQTKDTSAGKIGYIAIPVFTTKSPKAMQDALKALEAQNVKGYILDLRSNPGGVLDSSVAIARMLMGQGTVVSVVDYRGQKKPFPANNQALTNKPLLVLVDNRSASASEILAGALQDNQRAKLIGTRTFGKGLVQALEALNDGSAVKVSIARYFTPKGRDINKTGIEPDVVVPLNEQEWIQLLRSKAIATPADPQYTRALSQLTTVLKPQ